MQTKSFFNFILTLLVFSLFTSCNSPSANTNSASTESDQEQLTIETQWDARMEDYHNVMAGTFHPAEDGDLEPIKSMHEELASKAMAWKEASLPAVHAGKNFEESLADLVNQAEEIGAMVQNEASDEEITNALYGLHDVFHAIKGQCEEEH